MKEVILSNLPQGVDEAQVQTWFLEEGDAVSEGDELAEFVTDEATVIITAPFSGILAEVYFDEGETVARDEVVCAIEQEEAA